MRERLFRERIFFFGMVLVLIVIAFILIWPFVTPILFALAMVVILKPLYNRLLEARWIKGSEKRAAAATLLGGGGTASPITRHTSPGATVASSSS